MADIWEMLVSILNVFVQFLCFFVFLLFSMRYVVEFFYVVEISYILQLLVLHACQGVMFSSFKQVKRMIKATVKTIRVSMRSS